MSPSNKKSNRQSSKNKTNREKLAAAQRQAKIRAAAVVGGLLAVVVGGTVAWTAVNRLDGVTSYRYLGSVHQTEPVKYAESPPVGGPHNPTWLNCGVYTKPVEDDLAVHSLEHGAVWITYRADLPEAQRRTLEQLVDGRTYTLLSPYPGLKEAVVISAWNRQLRASDANDPRLAKFLAKFEQGTQAPERGAPCSGGVTGA
ncbi:DUF3105 domain-containing protein [Deinococcus hopiensis]|uniref:DUF3105 domain-containing protein n=1 Tax=Deinococcus hopiensis KR-140 TaxID=695939 RepID=A0A1W1UA17_9DEIO|nr:DUF3105 domain-containing protein [Deinococcus hopiensis]SMB77883.1 Protein of unknown function [Deinococcus hopiensis KR-140]